MLLNWLRVSIRRFRRSTTHALINIFGLSLGLFVFMVIFVYVEHEFRYDNFHVNVDRTYRLVVDNPSNLYQGVSRFAVMPAPLYEVLKNDIAGVEEAARLSKWGNLVVESENKKFFEEEHFATDPGLLKILTFETVAGDLAHALSRPGMAIISEKTAVKFFGSTDAVGKVIKLTSFKELGEYTVEAVFRDFPSNSSMHFNIILRFVDAVSAAQPTDLNDWNNSNYNFLVMLTPGADPSALERRLDEFYRKKWPVTDDGKSETVSHFIVQPLASVYLGPDVNFDFAPKNDPNRLYMLATIACFVLVVAAINYINLTTARAVSRAKEVAVRKVTGAQQRGLAFQFVGDSVVLTGLSCIVAYLATWYLFPAFRDFIGKDLDIDLITLRYIAGTLLLALAVGVTAGLYPALVLSSFQPAKVLKGSFSSSSEGTTLRNALTVLQFTVSSGLIIAVAIVSQQLTFIENSDPGYQRDHILSVRLTDEGVRAKKDFFVQELNRNPNIVSTSLATSMPHAVRMQQSRHWIGEKGEYDVAFYTIYGDENYIDLFDIKVIDGRNLSASDKGAFLINETAAKAYGWEDPVGMEFRGERVSAQSDTVRIVGVVKDMHIDSYRSPIKPLRIGIRYTGASVVAIKVKPQEIESTLAFIEKTYKSLATTDMPYTARFLHEEFSSAYRSDLQLSKLIDLFSMVAVVIACLGLYGLSTQSISQRLKEIGIRKILGAEASQIAYVVLSRSFLLIVIAFVLACPVAWYIMNGWLSEFAYHIEIGPWPFVVTGISILVIALATVAFQTSKAIRLKPTTVLRME